MPQGGRATGHAQGLMPAVVRIGLGIWSFFVPAITAAGFHTLAWILTGFVAASALPGLLFAPSNAGKSLDEIQEEQPGSGSRRFVRDQPVAKDTTLAANS